MFDWALVALTGVWGGLLALERRAFLQAMVSRPLVAGAATGALLGDPLSGLSVGLIFELLHLGGASLGGSNPEHDTLPAVTGAAFVGALSHVSGAPATPAMWALAVLLFAPMGVLGRRLEARFDQRARKYFGRAQVATYAGDLRGAARQNLRAMWPHFVSHAGLAAVSVVLGGLAWSVVEALPPRALHGLAWAYPAMGVVAAGVAIRGLQTNRRLLIAGLSAAFFFSVGFARLLLGQAV